ncbi:hypothetical protein ABW636_04810 [Aquimarina sp. 2201CG1-2-11]|uniref:hypothetical protein n=1 Tax=Aquimarina discodermiae TaxID=3231043 RepID=UPI0034618B66
MKFTLQQIRDVLAKKEYQYLDDDRAVNIIGIRSTNEIANSFDDWLYLIYKDENQNTEVHEFPITTDPGAYWLKNPSNINGTAILVPGQYKDAYRIGLHRGKYEALKQHKPVKVWRDNTRDTILDKEGKVYEGIFGINIHRSNARTESSIVEKWSAGCQVFKRVSDFSFLMLICKRSGYKNFTYTLLEETDFTDNNVNDFKNR